MVRESMPSDEPANFHEGRASASMISRTLAQYCIIPRKREID